MSQETTTEAVVAVDDQQVNTQSQETQDRELKEAVARVAIGSKKKSRIVNIQELILNGTEIGYVTAIHMETRTFFLQLIRFSNEELVDLNRVIHRYCNKVVAERTSNPETASPMEIRSNDIVCARYNKDNCFYRARVLKVNKPKKSCFIIFIDYGDIDEECSYDDIVLVSPKNIPEIERPPFGFTCFNRDSEKFSSKKIKHLLNSLFQSYVMVWVHEKQTSVQWLVEVVENGYNAPFLMIFEDLMGQEIIEQESKKRKSEINQPQQSTTNDPQNAKALPIEPPTTTADQQQQQKSSMVASAGGYIDQNSVIPEAPEFGPKKIDTAGTVKSPAWAG